ncbi:unnamed protein product, partial [Schistosoma intercalatum]
DVRPKFPFKYYGINVSKFEIFRHGYIRVFGEGNIGKIYNSLHVGPYGEYDVVDNNDFIAVKWYYEMWFSGTKYIMKITIVIHSGGKISLYYEDIPTGHKEIPQSSTIEGLIQCGDVRKVEIVTPGEWITSDTLVEIEPIGDVREPEITTPAELMTSDTSVNLKPIEGRLNLI